VDKIFSLLSACAALHPATSSSGAADLFGGLDPDSMVYADANGNVVGPGVVNDATEDAQDSRDDADQQDSEAGRVRSDFVAPGPRRGPY
jgi:nucleotide-sensitive chloride channel 1A